MPPVASTAYLDEVEALITRLFRVGLGEILLGVGLAFFASSIGVWPILVGIWSICCGVNVICHFRDWPALLSNSCCCPPLTATIAHVYLQPIVALACLASAGNAIASLVESATARAGTSSLTLISVALVISAVLSMTAAFAALPVARLRRLIEVHPHIGDPEAIRAHAAHAPVVVGFGHALNAAIAHAVVAAAATDAVVVADDGGADALGEARAAPPMPMTIGAPFAPFATFHAGFPMGIARPPAAFEQPPLPGMVVDGTVVAPAQPAPHSPVSCPAGYSTTSSA